MRKRVNEKKSDKKREREGEDKKREREIVLLFALLCKIPHSMFPERKGRVIL